MATIKFRLRGTKQLKEVYVRLSAGRTVNIQSKTNYSISEKQWRYDKVIKGANKGKPSEFGQPKQTDDTGKKLKEQLDILSTELNKRFNHATETGEPINPEWLSNQVRLIQNRDSASNTSKGDLLSYTSYYIDYLPNHLQSNGKRGVSKNTIQNFVTLKARLTGFQQWKKRSYSIVDVNPDFIQELDRFLRSKSYSDNYIGTLTTKLKTMCRHAKKEGLKVSANLDDITVVKEDTYKVILSFTELDLIKSEVYDREALDNARDWLIIGCYTGQRVSDLLKLTKDKIVYKAGLELIELTQVKTGKLVSLPIHPTVQEVLNKRSGEFPYKISDVKFNLYIKEVCRLAGITEPTQGSKTITEITKGNLPNITRKVKGIFPKWELITSHACRRSFATNHYGEIPTPILMSATGHVTEKMFLKYIGKTATEQAQQLAEYWTKAALMNKKETNLRVVKKAK